MRKGTAYGVYLLFCQRITVIEILPLRSRSSHSFATRSRKIGVVALLGLIGELRRGSFAHRTIGTRSISLQRLRHTEYAYYFLRKGCGTRSVPTTLNLIQEILAIREIAWVFPNILLDCTELFR